MAVRHRRHANPFAFHHEIERPDFTAVFGRKAPLEVEIGFGKGQFLLGAAALRPQSNFVGLEIREFLVDGVMRLGKERGLGNVFALQCNANTALETLFRPGEVSRFYVHFPDPWFKKRHAKRRVINEDTAHVICQLLRPTSEAAPGGEVHAMTDYEPIAWDMLRCLQAAGLQNVVGPWALSPKPTTEVQSEREAWHLSQNDPVYRLWLRRGEDPAPAIRPPPDRSSS